MKVLHICEYVKGGIATHLNQMVPYQLEQGLSVRLVVPSGHVEELQVDKDTLLTYPYDRRSVLGLLILFRIILSSIYSQRPDIVHIHSTFAGALARAAIVLLYPFSRPKVVYCAHGWSFSMQIPAWKKKIYAFVERILAWVTGGIINISHSESAIAAAYGLPARKMTTIYHGIEPDETLPVVTNEPNQPLSVVFVGRFDEQKGFDRLCEVIKKTTSQTIRFHIVGDYVVGQNEAKHPVLTEDPRVSHYGWRPREEVFTILKTMDIQLCPSRWEGFGYTCIEGLSQGLFCLVSDAGALPEHIKEDFNGKVFQDFDSTRVAEYLDRVERKAIQNKKLAIAQDARNRYSLDNMNNAILAMYRQLLA